MLICKTYMLIFSEDGINEKFKVFKIVLLTIRSSFDIKILMKIWVSF